MSFHSMRMPHPPLPMNTIRPYDRLPWGVGRALGALGHWRRVTNPNLPADAFSRAVLRPAGAFLCVVTTTPAPAT